MDDDTIIIASTFLLLKEEVADNNAKKKKKKTKGTRVRPFLLECTYVSFRERMSPDDFDYLLNLVTPSIEKANTNMRESLCPGKRLAITLRFLATGDSYPSLMFLFKRSSSSICNIVPEVCAVLKYEFLEMPATDEEWESISQSINKMWNFPN